MDYSQAVILQAPAIHQWPWKHASPNVFWRVHIGRRIQARREQMPADAPSEKQPHMSREALARHLDLPAFTVREIETGIVGVDANLLARLAEILHVHPGWFFDFEPLPVWVTQVEKNRFLHRMAAILSPIAPGDFDIVETVFRYLARRRLTPAGVS